jgi:oligopeptide/dipeptide ABC transporter ATP-binding protein
MSESSPSRQFEEALLAVDALTLEFDTPHGPLRAVDGVTFTVDRGNTLGIVGESGSGKSVLLRTIMGLLPSDGVRRSGSVRFEGRELTGLARRDVRRLWGSRIALVLQDPMTSLNPVVRVGRQISEVVPSQQDGERIDRWKRALELLRVVGIPEPKRRIRQYPHEMSGGMRQRVAIAIALAGDPRLLLADEPTTALDVTVQAQVLDLLSRLQGERQMAMILVSHDLGVVATRAAQILVMYAGQVVEQAPTRELFRSPRMPYTEALLKSIPRLDQPRHSNLFAIKGRPPNPLELYAGCRFAPRCSYAQDRCLEESPPLTESDTAGHHFRCWFPVGTEAGEKALASNRAAAASK